MAGEMEIFIGWTGRVGDGKIDFHSSFSKKRGDMVEILVF